MSNRISTSMMFSQSVSLMMAKQAKMNHLEQQIATGSKITSAKDDPVNAGAAVGLDRTLAALDQMKLNANNVQKRLGLQENTLARINDLMGRVNDLTLQASSPTLSAADKKTVGTELNQIREGLPSLANTSDGTGRYLFGGTHDGDPPFSQVNGKIVYSGDQTHRQVEVGPDTYVKDALLGSEIFLRIPTGDGTVDGSAAAGNTGKAVLTNITRDGGGGWNGQPFSVRFTSATQYEVVDGTGNVTGTGTMKAGDDLVINGVRLQVAGEPAAGDSFNVQAAGGRDVFSTLDNLISALGTDTGTSAQLWPRSRTSCRAPCVMWRVPPSG
ncbi:MAG: Flagellar hook-associated protein 3 [Stenotrophomonas maltophilia]|uniref:Flagellar hook-associated protein 3 n=1 Tax=Stenotrophomonas maltophilia TaxID=40324 RepID=A0A7V8FJH8_STEMA|nr:MAG: Flagellar hook-associated protein 3 [Stenotrophomonas maltophilia]